MFSHEWCLKVSVIKFTDNLHISPLERSYKCKVLAHYPENYKNNPFDESAVSMVSLYYYYSGKFLL